MCSLLGLTAGVIASCGPSQVIGTGILVGTGVNAIIHKAQEKFTDDPHKAAKAREKLKRDKEIAKAAGLAMIPIIGVPLSGKFKNQGFGYSTADFISDAPLVNRGISKIANMGGYPLSGLDPEIFIGKYTGFTSFAAMRNITISYLNLGPQTEETMARQIQVPVEGRDNPLDAVWKPSGKPNAGTVILFHGNGMTLDGVLFQAQYFNSRGLNVYLQTMGGYPNSCAGTQTSELSTYEDVKAAVEKVKELTGNPANDKIIAYGISIGGSLAFQAGYKYPGIHVISDQTFTRISDVPQAMISSQWAGAIGKEAMKTKFDSDAVKVKDGYEIDGLNNVRKASQLQGSYFGLYSTVDQLMSTPRGGNLTLDIADEFVANHPAVNREDIIASYAAPHGSSFYRADKPDELESYSHVEKLQAHLKRIGMI